MATDSKHAYRFDFLKSEEWSTIRAEVLAAEKGHCFVCEVEDSSNDVHHMFYRRFWKDTAAKDCHVLCRRCHELVHERMGKDELKGMSAFDLGKAFGILADVLRGLLKEEIEANRIGRVPETPEVIEVVKKGPRPKKPSDFLRAELERVKLELAKVNPDAIKPPKPKNDFAFDPDFIGPQQPKRPSDFLRQAYQKAKDKCETLERQVACLERENRELRRSLGVDDYII